MKPCVAACALLALVPFAAWADKPFSVDDLDGAITLQAMRGPDYIGARTYGNGIRPGIYVRWGRLSVSSGGSWAAVRQDEEVRGLGIELRRTERLRVSLGLRFDSGRDESSAPALAGMGDVKRTVRARIGATWRFKPDWMLVAAWTIDAFGRGGGNLGEAKLQHDWQLTPRVKLTSGMTVALAGDRYLQTYYGVTPEQSARTGYAVYSPRMSLRDATVFSTLQADLGDDWVGQFGLGLTRVLGDAAHSPLTQRTTAWSANTGIGWRF